MARFAVFFALLAFVAVTAVDIKFDTGDDDKIALASFGSEIAFVSVLYRGPEAEATISQSEVFSVGQIETKEAAGGFTNYTIPLTLDKTVGREQYVVTIGELSITGTITVAGFVVVDDDGRILSGDNGAGIDVGQSGTTTYTVKTVGIDGKSVDISGTRFSYKEMSGVYMKEIDESRTKITSTLLTIAISEYRVGTGDFMIMMESEAIEFEGEFFETVVNVRQETSPAPPCVAIGGEYTAKDGFVQVSMFNLLNPPLASDVETVTIEIDGESSDWDKSRSTLTNPDQIVAFKVTTNGRATITCDGVEAEYLGGAVEVSGASAPTPTPTPSPSSDQAVSIVDQLPDSETLSQFVTVVTIEGITPADLSRQDGQNVVDLFCNTLVRAENCRLTDIRSGSAILELGALVDQDDVQQSRDNLEKTFACDVAAELEMDCDKVTLGKTTVNAVAAVGGASAGLAAWAIILIACVGAFALILVIVLGLWAVYRRSAEQSESDYSSSGPLGVPDPSDLLYEQSIVRDIYGRGDFPEGGPTQAVAEQRAREADLREEFPRPPSSTGHSRGAATDDASSTYSV